MVFDTTEGLFSMIPKTVLRSSIFSEFNDFEKENWFSLTRAKVLPHIDNIYYNVYIVGDSGETPPDGLILMLKELADAKSRKMTAYGNDVALWDLDVFSSNYATYEYRLSQDENFDVFVASYLPNDDTPRIQVQIRSRFLVLRGVDNALHDSFAAVEKILSYFQLQCNRIVENRIDYAYHTNLLQNPIEYFNDKSLVTHLKSVFRTGQKVFNVSDSLDLSYMSLGKRQSNCLFFRVYDKSREVCEKAYKSFFLDRWVQNGLISRFDYECYLEAYQNKSYEVGLLIGRLKWYLVHGHNEKLKSDLSCLLESCYVKNCNSDAIRKTLRGVVPEVTVIVNVEFETKRKFYTSLGEWLDFVGPSDDMPAGLQPQFWRLHRIFTFQQSIHDYLTYNVVRFVRDRNGKEDSKTNPMLDWWYRIHACRVAEWPAVPNFARKFSHEPDLDRAKKNFLSSTATLTMLLNQSVESSDFVSDISDVLADLNDNSFHGFLPDENGVVDLPDPLQYQAIRRRKEFRNRHVIELLRTKQSSEASPGDVSSPAVSAVDAGKTFVRQNSFSFIEQPK